MKNKIFIFGLLLTLVFGCKKSKKENAFEVFNEGVSLSLDAVNLAEKKNYTESETLTTKAIEKFKKTLIIDPEHKGAASALGHSYYVIRDYQNGIEWYEKAIKIDSKSAINYLEYGLCKINKGDIKGGKNEIDKSLEIDNSNKNTEQAVYSLLDIGLLAFKYGEKYEKNGEIKKGKGYKTFALNVLNIAHQIDSLQVDVINNIAIFTKKLKTAETEVILEK